MFERVINRLMEIQAPATRKLKIPIAGIRAFEAILESNEILNVTTVVDLALREFSKYSKGDSQVASDFEKFLLENFQG